MQPRSGTKAARAAKKVHAKRERPRRTKSGARAIKIPERGIGGLLHEGARVFKAELQKRLAAFRVPPSHWFHLRQLWSDDGLTQVELSQKLGIEKASSTAVLDALVAKGLIRRARRKEDRRKISLHLTPAGRRLTERLIGCAVAVNAIARQGLSDREVATFLQVLDAMTTNLRAAAGSSNAPPS